MSGRKVELDEVTIPAPLLESSTSQKPVSVTPTPISEEANDDDHETSDQVTTKPRRSSKVQSAPDCSVTIYKARLVAAFRQVQGVEYDEIFSLVSMLKSV